MERSREQIRIQRKKKYFEIQFKMGLAFFSMPELQTSLKKTITNRIALLSTLYSYSLKK